MTTSVVLWSSSTFDPEQQLGTQLVRKLMHHMAIATELQAAASACVLGFPSCCYAVQLCMYFMQSLPGLNAVFRLCTMKSNAGCDCFAEVLTCM